MFVYVYIHTYVCGYYWCFITLKKKAETKQLVAFYIELDIENITCDYNSEHIVVSEKCVWARQR